MCPTVKKNQKKTKVILSNNKQKWVFKICSSANRLQMMSLYKLWIFRDTQLCAEAQTGQLNLGAMLEDLNN